MLSNYLAEIWGISMIVVSLALLIKERHIKTIFSAILTDTGMFLSGVLSFMIGLAMVLAHNTWVNSWTTIITIIGWITLLKGVGRLFMPEKCIVMIKKLENATFLPYLLIAAVFVGLIITYLGFTA